MGVGKRGAGARLENGRVGGGKAWRQAPVLREKALLVTVQLGLGWQGHGRGQEAGPSPPSALVPPIATSPSASGQLGG